jgi:hypothetical protein
MWGVAGAKVRVRLRHEKYEGGSWARGSTSWYSGDRVVTSGFFILLYVPSRCFITEADLPGENKYSHYVSNHASS